MLALGCSKKDPKAERDELCRAAKTTFVSGMHDQIAQLDKQGQKDAADAFRAALATSEPRFDEFCHALTDDEMTCVEQMPAAMSDPKCAHTVELVKTKLLGM